MKNLSKKVLDHVNAAFSGLWITSYEVDEAEKELRELATTQKWNLASWNGSSGIRTLLEKGRKRSGNQQADAQNDPIAAIKALPALGSSDNETAGVLVMHNLHRFLNNPELIQATFNALVDGKSKRLFIVVLSPTSEIPVELQKVFVVLDHPMPDRQQINTIASELISANPEAMPTGAELERVLDAAAGLTRYEAEGAFSLSLARHGEIKPDEIWELKSQALRKTSGLRLHRGSERFADLGGLDNLKDFCSRVLRHRTDKIAQPRGIMLLGLPGSGKTQFCKALGNESGRPLLHLDIGSLYGSLVGQTEAAVRQALRIADAMAPAILLVDEIEKGLAGVGGSGDSGVASRLFGTLLTWLSDHESDVFFVGTSNDMEQLSQASKGAFSRAERFDGVFFLDLPTSDDRGKIWKIYQKMYKLPEQKLPVDVDWTGAEIKACCRLASLLGISLIEASINVVPVANTAHESISKLRNWASGRCLSASTPGRYELAPSSHGKSARRSIQEANPEAN